MKYNIDIESSFEKESLIFSDLEDGDIFYIVSPESRCLCMKLSYAFGIYHHDDDNSFSNLFNAVFIDDGKPLHVSNDACVGKLLTSITFYQDDFTEFRHC